MLNGWLRSTDGLPTARLAAEGSVDDTSTSATGVDPLPFSGWLPGLSERGWGTTRWPKFPADALNPLSGISADGSMPPPETGAAPAIGPNGLGRGGSG